MFLEGKDEGWEYCRRVGSVGRVGDLCVCEVVGLYVSGGAGLCVGVVVGGLGSVEVAKSCWRAGRSICSTGRLERDLVCGVCLGEMGMGRSSRVSPP